MISPFILFMIRVKFSKKKNSPANKPFQLKKMLIIINSKIHKKINYLITKMAISSIKNNLISCIKMNIINLRIPKTISLRNKTKVCTMNRNQVGSITLNYLLHNRQMDGAHRQILNICLRMIFLVIQILEMCQMNTFLVPQINN